MDDTTRWKCINRKCSTVLYTKQTNPICFESENVIHTNHSPYTRNSIERLIVNTGFNKIAKEYFHIKPKKIVMQEICETVALNNNIKYIKKITKNITIKNITIFSKIGHDRL